MFHHTYLTKMVYEVFFFLFVYLPFGCIKNEPSFRHVTLMWFLQIIRINTTMVAIAITRTVPIDPATAAKVDPSTLLSSKVFGGASVKIYQNICILDL